MNDEVFESVKKFTVEHTFVTDVLMTRSTMLYEDLGIYGDDAVEFFEGFSNVFNVDVSNFEISKYFQGEGGLIFRSIFNLFKRKEKEVEYDLRPITLGDLEKAIIAGKLDDTVLRAH